MSENKNILKLAILSASIMVASAAAINADIPRMAEAMPEHSLAMVEMLTTISSLFLMISLLTSDYIARKIGYKQTIMVGLCIVTVSGVLPAIIGNFYVVLAARSFLGFGIGLFNSLLVVMVNYFFDEKERSSLFGMQSACEGIGGVVITFIAGQLMTVDWQAPFYAYLIAIISVVLFGYFVPNVPITAILEKTVVLPKQAIIRSTSFNDSFIMIGYVAIIFLIAILYMTMGIKTATLMVSSGYGNLNDASMVFMFVGLGAIFSGFFFGKINAWLKKGTLVAAFLCMAFSMFFIGVTNNVIVTIWGGFLLGFGFRIAMPYLINVINTGAILNKSLATSMLLVGYNLGIFVTPYANQLVLKWLGPNNLRLLFYIDGVVFLVLAMGALASTLFLQKSSNVEQVYNS